MRKKIAATCTIVLILPHPAAGTTTPCAVAAIRVRVTASSRAMMTIATQAGSRPSETSETSAATTSSLSATGSMSLPNVVIEFARAGEAAVDRVGQRRGREDDGRQ